MKKITTILLVGGLLTLTSCATIISGSKQKVSFTSTPAEASVFIKNAFKAGCVAKKADQVPG